MNDRPLDPEALALLLATDGLGPEVPGAAELRGLRAQLREATAGSIDVADDVMLGVALSAAVMGKVDVADEVMLGVQLAEALAPSRVDRAVDVADAVMAQIGARASTMPRWASLGVLGGGAGLAALAMAAALLLAVFGPWSGKVPQAVTAEVGAPMIALAQFNQAEVEDLVVADGAVAQVMQFEEGGPTIIFVEEES